jgi:hypothetical protein
MNETRLTCLLFPIHPLLKVSSNRSDGLAFGAGEARVAHAGPVHAVTAVRALVLKARGVASKVDGNLNVKCLKVIRVCIA